MKTSKLLTYWPYLLAFLVLSAWSLWQFPWHLSSSDAVFYLMNAEELSRFQLSDSISSYWSPLWSWMMVPFFWMGLADLWPMKVLQILIGAYGLILGLRILDRLELRPTLHLTGGILFLLACWMMHLSHTPDLLMAVLLLQFFYWTWTNQTTVLRSGLIGGALFLCKSFGFPFFVAYLFIHTIWKYWNTKQRSILFQGLKTIGFFAVIAGAWIGIMALKFGWVGLGTSGSYNMAYMGPIMNFQPPYFNQFVNPETTFTNHFIAEEQGLFADYGAWSPFGDASGFQYYRNHLVGNFSKLYYISFLRDGLLILLFFLAGWWIRRLEPAKKHRIFLGEVLIFLGIYLGGYYLLFPNERYLWIANLMFIPVLLVFFSGFRQIRIIGGFQLLCLGILFGTNLLAFASIRLEDHSFYEALHLHESELKEIDLSEKKIISNRRPNDRKLKDHMDVMSYFCYKYDIQLWGLLESKTLQKEGLFRLETLPIDYFFYWEKVPGADVHFQQHSLIQHIPAIDLKIYQLNK